MGPLYRDLRIQYIAELRAAKNDVNKWWGDLVAAAMDECGTEEAAESELRWRWPVGPAAHPRFLAVIRKYYLACHKLNQDVRLNMSSDPENIEEHVLEEVETGSEEGEIDEQDMPINPAVFVGESLFTQETNDLATIVGELTYWPIGIEKNGTYV